MRENDTKPDEDTLDGAEAPSPSDSRDDEGPGDDYVRAQARRHKRPTKTRR